MMQEEPNRLNGQVANAPTDLAEAKRQRYIDLLFGEGRKGWKFAGFTRCKREITAPKDAPFPPTLEKTLRAWLQAEMPDFVCHVSCNANTLTVNAHSSLDSLSRNYHVGLEDAGDVRQYLAIPALVPEQDAQALLKHAVLTPLLWKPFTRGVPQMRCVVTLSDSQLQKAGLDKGNEREIQHWARDRFYEVAGGPITALLTKTDTGMELTLEMPEEFFFNIKNAALRAKQMPSSVVNAAARFQRNVGTLPPNSSQDRS